MSPIEAATASTRRYKKAPSFPSSFAWREALLMMRLNTYPLPSFDGINPSERRKVIALIWSAITLIDMSLCGFLPYAAPDNDSTPEIIAENISVSKFVFLCCMTAVILSSPIPVSMLGFGRGASAPDSSLLYCMKTRFHNSRYLSHSHPTLQSDLPQPKSSP